MALTCGEGGSTGVEVLTQINDNTEGISGLQGIFYYQTNKNIVDIPDTYTNINNLPIPNMVKGVYVVNMSITYQLNITNKSVLARFSLNGGVEEVFSKEPKDATDRVSMSYAFPYEHLADGNFSIVTDMRKEDSSGILNVHFGNVWVERKGDLPIP